MKLVSIIIPAYNAQKYIRETIQSVLDQTYSNWELIIVNDGSNDNTEEIVERFNDPRLRYFKQPNAGVSTSRNNGLEMSKGEYIAFLDADDIWLPDNLSEKITFLEHHQDCGLVHGDTQVINEKSEKQKIIYQGKSGWILDDLLLWNGCCIPAPSSILIQRNIIKKTGNWDPQLSTAADQEFFFRVAKNFKIGRIPKVLSLYREHTENMHLNIDRLEKEYILTYIKAEKYGLFKSYIFKKKCFSNLYFIIAGSWWVNENNKVRGIYFIVKALLTYPPFLIKLIAKI